jgi:Lecithin retinol acyltransferase
MKNVININQLKPADKIIVPKSQFNLVQHHAIYLGKDHFGEDLIAENIVGKYVCITPASEFFATNPIITDMEPFVGDNLERRRAVERALQLMGKPYDLINFNCEHFANEVQTGIAFSSQVRIGVGVVIVIAVIAALWD